MPIASKSNSKDTFNYLTRPLKWYVRELSGIYAEKKECYILRCQITGYSRQYSSDTVNSLWHSYVVWRCRSRSTWAQLMASCLTAPSHYLNLGWITITGSEVLWHSPGSYYTVQRDLHPFQCNFKVNAQDMLAKISIWNKFVSNFVYAYTKGRSVRQRLILKFTKVILPYDECN